MRAFHWSHLKNKLGGIAGDTTGLHPITFQGQQRQAAVFGAPHTFAAIDSGFLVVDMHFC